MIRPIKVRINYHLMEWGLKYVFRVLHIGPVTALAGKIIYDALFSHKGSSAHGSKEEKMFYMVMGILLIVAGFVNTFLLTPKKAMGEVAGKQWIAFHHLKLLISIIVFTPLAPHVLQDQERVTVARFGVVLLFLLLSPAMRFYREYHTKTHTRIE